MSLLTVAVLALVGLQEPAKLQGIATEPGLTVWVWQGAGRISRHPTVAEGQVPNAYLNLPTLDVKDGFQSQEGLIKDNFIG
ncbi:MAG: hypothetical protein H7Y17_08040, partial [Chlorobia bacterium]|nr:hypothetical protein [Fimbriimonadaceae bacterium]